eukprot:scaffold36275_cov154-Isochrysis_galbana.AAC.43
MAEGGVANLQMDDATAHRRNVNSTVATRRTRVSRVHAEDVEHVAEVETDGADLQLHLAVDRFGVILLLRYNAQVANGAAGVEVQLDRASQRAGSLGETRHPLARAVKGDLRLRGRVAKTKCASSLADRGTDAHARLEHIEINQWQARLRSLRTGLASQPHHARVARGARSRRARTERTSRQHPRRRRRASDGMCADHVKGTCRAGERVQRLHSTAEANGEHHRAHLRRRRRAASLSSR